LDRIEPQTSQPQQVEWSFQWSRHSDDAPFLFSDWIAPRTVEDFRGKRVFDAGCGPGHHVRLVASVASHVTGMDLNTANIASEKLSDLENVDFLQGDIAAYQPDQPFDVVYCIGVIHHTDDPDRTFENLRRMCQKGSLLIVWCYSLEGNELVQKLVEPIRKRFLRKLNRGVVEFIAQVVTLFMYPVVYTIYLLPLRSLPFYEYFENFRTLTFKRNVLNVFDKLNAPQTDFIARGRIERWFHPGQFDDVSITPYKGVSWRASGFVK
jgi:SAM-dependent methyltransferase